MSSPRWSDLPEAVPPGTFVCRLESLPDGVASIVLVRTRSTTSADDDRSVSLLLLRTGDAISAYVNRCAHFGVPLARTQQLLLFTPNVSLRCNVHYAEYRWSDGHCLSGECDGEPLIPVPVDLEPDGDIRIAGSAATPGD